MNKQDAATRLRRQGRIFRVLATWATILTGVSVFVQLVAAAAPLWHGGPVRQTLITTAEVGILLAPPVFYIIGLVRSRKVFTRIARGEIFVSENCDGLVSVGTALVVGAVWAMAVAGLEPLVPPSSLAPIMRDVAAGASQLALAALGLALLMIGRVMSRAVRLKAEVDGFV